MSAPNDDISLEDILGQLSTFESEVPVAKNSENTVDTSIVPIVVVPGVMGSKLKFSDGATWDPDSQATMLLDWISFATRAVYSRFKGASATVTGDTGLLGDRGVGELVAKFYLNFLTFLSATFSPISGAFCPVHAVGYNWTQSCAKSAERLDQRLQEILKQWGAKKAVIVTHSMGGLVARAACQRPGFADRVAGIVHTVQPALGASVAYRQFLTGSTSVSKDKSIAERAFDMLAGDEWWKYMAYMSVLGGPVELLPNDTYRLTASNGAWLQHLRGDHTTGGETVVPVNTLFTLATYLTNQFPGVVFDYDGSVASGAAGGFFGFEWVDIQTNLRINLANGRLFHTRLGFEQPSNDVCPREHRVVDYGGGCHRDYVRDGSVFQV